MTDQPLPDIFLGGRYDLGATSLDLPTDPKLIPPQMQPHPFLQALQTHHLYDAHFVTYHLLPPNSNEPDPMPRLTKPILGHVLQAGARIVTHSLVVDWDTPGHRPFTPETREAMWSQLLTLAAEWPLAGAWTVLYTTRAGFRLIYVLQISIDVQESEDYQRGLIAEFRARGIMVDELGDWTRLYRAPFVQRDGVATAPDTEYLEQLDQRLDGKSLPAIAGFKAELVAGVIKPFTDPMPEYAVASAMRGIGSKDSELIKIAKKYLRGRLCYDALFMPGARPLAKGERDQTLISYIGEAIGQMYVVPGLGPIEIYAIFLPIVEQLAPDIETPDWFAKAWDMIGRVWAKEESVRGAKELQAASKTQELRTVADQLIEGVKSWPVRSHPPEVDGAYLTRHLIASTGGSAGLYLMETAGEGKGFYRPHPINQTNLIPSIRTGGLAALIQTALPPKGKNTDPTDRTPAAIINEHATVIREVWLEPGDGQGGYIEGADTSGATMRVRAFARSPKIHAQFNEEVDEWLHAFAGTKYDTVAKWIAYSLAFEEGTICALSIKGPAGSGKKLLYMGLSECMAYPDLATGRDLVNDFNDGLLKSPFLVINEGWPAAGRGMHPADQFRALVSGDPIVVNQKFQAPVRVTCGVRVLFLANNSDVVRMLSHKRDLSPEDRNALAVRLLHININTEATDWLRTRGGMAITGREGHRWIRGDGGQASDYIVARHFMWLYEQRAKLGAPGPRFLVEGNASKEILFELRTATGSSPLVIESLIGMIEAPAMKWDGMVVEQMKNEDGTPRAPQLFVLPHDILKFYRDNIREKNGGMSLSLNQINNALSGLTNHEPESAFHLPSRQEMGAKYWWEVDCETLVKVAQRDGHKSPKLADLVKRQEACK